MGTQSIDRVSEGWKQSYGRSGFHDVRPSGENT